MKKNNWTVLFVLAVCLVLCLTAHAAVLGDVDGNGKREAGDARLTLRASVGLEAFVPGTAAFAAADADGNGVIQASDARAILRTAVSLEILPEDPAEVTADEALVDPEKGWDAYDALVKRIKTETDKEKRAALMHKSEDMLMATGCVVPLYYYNDVYLQKQTVQGVYASVYGTKYFTYASKTDGSETLRVCLASEPDTLDPALTASVDGASLAAAAFSGLYTYDENGKTVPACAEGYTVSDNGCEYRVTLKEGLRWSDGSPLTASDFVYAWKRAATSETGADYAYLFERFEGYDEGEINVSFADERTLCFVLTSPCAYMEDLMAFPTFFPVKKAVVSAPDDWADNPGSWCSEAGFVSNGPFVCTAWEHDVSMTYEKNPYWYDADNVTLEKLEFKLCADDTVIYAAYKAGGLDFADAVPYDAFAALENDPQLHVIDELGTYYAAFNAKSPLFAGKTAAQAACMRQALSLLIDRDFICKDVMQAGQLPADAFIPYGMADGNGGLFHPVDAQGYYDVHAVHTDYHGTLDRARQLLYAAGYRFGEDGKLSAETPISLTYITNASSGHVAIANAILQDFEALGIELTVQEKEWNVFLEERASGNFDMARGGWIADFNDPINMLEMWTTDSENNSSFLGR